MSGRRLRRAGATAGLTAALVLAVGVAAHATGPTASPSPSASATTAPTPSATASPTPSATPDPARSAEVRAIAQRVAALQAEADRTGRAAAAAGEHANDAKATAQAARLAARDADTAASAAVAQAQLSRARAAVVAARLARTDYGTLPLDLMLNGRSAGGVLGGLTTAGQLSGQAKALYLQASADAADARRLQADRADAAKSAAAAESAATKAYADAKAEALTSESAVGAALAEQQRILLAVAGRGGTALADTCAALGTTDVSACAVPGSASGSTIGDRVVAFARAQIGDPYVFAAAGPDAWDCSGLTLGAWASVGVSIGIHSATAQYRLALAQGDLVPLASATPGDLLFYTDGGGDMEHVTIYSGNGRMVEAPYPGAVVREVPVRTQGLVPTAAHFAGPSA